MPESNFTWTRAPSRRASARNGADQTTTSAPAATAASSSAPVMGPKMRIGAVSPAARSSSASATAATPSQVAPASSAARATGTAPCPYPFALTTAQCTAPAGRSRISRRTLWRMASRSTSASARWRPASIYRSRSFMMSWRVMRPTTTSFSSTTGTRSK